MTPPRLRPTADVATDGFDPVHGAQVGAALEAVGSHDPALGVDLAGWLYARWYAATPTLVGAGMGTRATSTDAGAPAWAGQHLTGALTAAHAGTDRWQGGGVVVATGRAGAVVVRTSDGHVRALGRGDYLCPPGRQGLTPVVGAALRTRQRHGCVVADGWWRTWGELRPTSAEGVSRIYLAPRPDDVTRLVRSVTAALAGTGLSWTLKVGGDPRTLTRADGAVVYLPDEDLDTALQLLLPAVDGLLHPDVPPLTCRVAPGLAWAHDPGDGRSFG
ncbi:MAG TPA: T3SS effector HopA1 family protein, partial [Euzebya sp.]|nr:T3SS effector HopA1 family protein [Euzebya sp.]